ncbi:hypothetical protein M0813_13236 [Anaeramoeba flamelloides]|uniref:FHA domain-containing protein n=1 Tax=Anaeramoeba flamelloides TaxID=1746091 RepID=A0ABQ8ZAB9_9EUKA|nr:hypothetical protein M0813_13236 [Anaeramoeba flamelloides]
MENRSNPLKRTFSQSTLQNNNPWGRVIIIGENQTQFNLLSPLFIIGRNHHCNLVIKDKSISSKHCIISIEKMKREDGIEIHKTFIQDFSTHGTFVDSIVQFVPLLHIFLFLVVTLNSVQAINNFRSFFFLFAIE